MLIFTFAGLSLRVLQAGVERTVTPLARLVSAGQSWAGNATASGPARILPSIAEAVALAMLVSMVLHRVRTRREIRKLREELARQSARAEAGESANAAKTEFLGSVSHQIRTPLNAIMGFTELALKTDLAPQLRDYLDTVRTSADWLVRTVDDVFEFSQLETGALKLENVPFSLSECIVSAMKRVAQEAGAKKLVTACRIDPQLPGIVRGDPTRLRHIVLNLLDNAVKFTTTGSVIVSAALESDTAADVLVRVTVTDTGIGIPSAKQQHIFEPFRVDESATFKSRASLLGLATSRRLLELMGGTITLRSQLGAGSTFEFTARFEKENGAEVESAPSETAPEATVGAPDRLGLQELSILVVDDDAVSRYLVMKVFESAGHRVWVAANGEQALHYTRTEAFDLIFMDLEMPDLDGLDITREIRKNEAPCVRVPIYALTAHASPDDRQRCIEAGMDGFLTKPVPVEELVKLVSKVAPRGASIGLDSTLACAENRPSISSAHDEQTTSRPRETRCAPASIEHEIAAAEEIAARPMQAGDAGAGATLSEFASQAIWKNTGDLAVDAADDSYAPQTSVKARDDFAVHESSWSALDDTERDVGSAVNEGVAPVHAISGSEAGYGNSEHRDLIARGRMSVPLGLALLQSTAGSMSVSDEENGRKTAAAVADPFEQARKALSKSRFDVRVIHNNGDPSGRNLI